MNIEQRSIAHKTGNARILQRQQTYQLHTPLICMRVIVCLSVPTQFYASSSFSLRFIPFTQQQPNFR